MKNWNVTKLFNALDKKYTDIQNYFVEDIPFFKYAEDMESNISDIKLNMCMTVKDMLDYKEE